MKLDAFAKTHGMSKQKFRPAGGFSGAKASIEDVEILKNHRNAVGWTFRDAIKLVCGLAALLICLSTTPAIADDWGPWEVNKHPQEQRAANSSVLQTAVQLFQKYISPVDGQRCVMYPTCSSYSLQALHKHGPLMGVFMTVDRIYHEDDPIEQQHPINKWGYIRFYDPLEKNDWWLD